MYKKILIPVDMAHTEKAAQMIKAAKCMASDDADFILTNIVQSAPSGAELSLPADFYEVSIKAAKSSLRKIAQEEGIEVKIEVHIGHPANDILNVANQLDVELIIVGSHRPDLKDYLIGSTAARIVRHAQCPVLVMR
ncbi:MAG: universal stress protein [Pseudomonadota bacterium]